MEEGSKIYAEETAGGRLLKLKVTCVDVIPNKKFSLRLPFPDSLFASYKYVIEPRGNKTAFTAFTYLKYPGFTRRKIAAVIDVGKKHVKEEGENLKRYLRKAKYKSSGSSVYLYCPGSQ